MFPAIYSRIILRIKTPHTHAVHPQLSHLPTNSQSSPFSCPPPATLKNRYLILYYPTLSTHNPFDWGNVAENENRLRSTRPGCQEFSGLQRGKYDPHAVTTLASSPPLPQISPSYPSLRCNFHLYLFDVAFRFLHLDLLVVSCSVASTNPHQSILYILYSNPPSPPLTSPFNIIYIDAGVMWVSRGVITYSSIYL